MKDNTFVYYTAWGEKRLTRLGAIAIIFGAFIVLVAAAFFFGERFLSGLVIGIVLGAVILHWSNERDALNRTLRERDFQ